MRFEETLRGPLALEGLPLPLAPWDAEVRIPGTVVVAQSSRTMTI
jgi:hypothetical protein